MEDLARARVYQVVCITRGWDPWAEPENMPAEHRAYDDEVWSYLD